MVSEVATYPRTAAHFVFVRIVELDEQTTSPSRHVLLSGASPDFTPPNPLSGKVLIAAFSCHFQEFQALKALAGSYSPHALTGTYTLLLSARQTASRCDPGHRSLPCRTPPPILTRFHVRPSRLRLVFRPASRCPACLRGGFSSCVCAFSGLTDGTPTAGFSIALRDAIPHSTNQELALEDESSGHRLSPHQHKIMHQSVSESHGLSFS